MNLQRTALAVLAAAAILASGVASANEGLAPAGEPVRAAIPDFVLRKTEVVCATKPSPQTPRPIGCAMERQSGEDPKESAPTMRW